MSNPMRPGFRRPLPAALLAIAAASGWTLPAHADSIPVAAQTDYFRGTQTSVSTFQVPGAGMLTVSLHDLDWPSALASLSFSLTNATSVINTLDGKTVEGVGTFQYDVSGPGMYAAIVNGTAGPDNPFGLGAYSYNVQFTSAVPLPASVILLLSGLGAIAAALYGRRPVATV